MGTFLLGALTVAAIAAALVVAAIFVWRWMDDRRSQSWRDHEDEMMETITEQRIRRNFMQGGG